MLCGFWAISQGVLQVTHRHADSECAMQTEMMNVTGMKCGGCPIKLSLALKESVGVEDVQISLASGEVTVRYDEIRTSPSHLKDVIIRTGFGVDGIAATSGHDPTPDHCG